MTGAAKRTAGGLERKEALVPLSECRKVCQGPNYSLLPGDTACGSTQLVLSTQ